MLKQRQCGENKWKITISNVKYDKGNIAKWQVKYKLVEDEHWNTTEDYSFVINKKGIYNIKLVNTEVEGENIVPVGLSNEFDSSKSNYYLIMMEETKQKFKGRNNIGTMAEFKDLVNAGNFNYNEAYVIEDLDLKTDRNHNWEAIGNKDNPFKAILYGGDYTIQNIYLENTLSNQGIFGYITGSIKNLNVENLYISNKKEEDAFIGGIVGYNNGGTVENCQLKNSQVLAKGNDVGGIVGCNYKGKVIDCKNFSIIRNEGRYATGGIVGWNYTKAIIKGCVNFGEIVTSKELCGGIAGTNEKNSLIENSHNEAIIKSNPGTYDNNTNQYISRIGGIVGINREAKIKNCYNIGKIIASGLQAGGICGLVESKIATENVSVEECYNEGEVICENIDGQIGGIAGYIHENAVIKSCYNVAKVTGTYDVGGIVGLLGYTPDIEEGTILTCYNTGEINITTGNCIGGIAGNIKNGYIRDCYNIGKVTGKSSNIGGITSYQSTSIKHEVYNNYYLDGSATGGINNTDIPNQAQKKSIQEMKNRDIIEILNSSDSNAYIKDENNKNSGYPILKWQNTK